MKTRSWILGIFSVLIIVVLISLLFCVILRLDICYRINSILFYWNWIFEGFIMMLWLYVWALVIGFFLGLFLAILRQYGGRIISTIATGYIEIMRGTPLIAQVFFFRYLPLIPIGDWTFFVSFTLIDKDITLVFLNSRILIGILTLSFNSAAYQAEYFRGAIISVGTGQLMAAQSLGMSRLAGIRHVVLPQALRRVIPAWSNEAAYLPKYTVVVQLIGVSELFGKGVSIFAIVPEALITYIIIALIFLLTITIISKGLDILHKRTAIPGF